MKKLSTIIIVLMVLSTAITAQPFKVKSNVIGLGIGFGSTIGNYSSATQVPGFHALYEKGVWNVRGVDVISLGGYLGYKGFNNEVNYGFGPNKYKYTEKWNYTIVGFRSCYHYNGFTKLPKLDVYGGAMLSFNFLNYVYEDNDPFDSDYYDRNYNNSVTGSIFVGGRYFFTENFGAYSELGFGVNTITAGICFKF